MSIKRPTLPFNGSSPTDPPADHYVLGGHHVGDAIARRLQADGRTVVVVDDPPPASDIASIRGDPADATALADADLADAATVVVATPSDARNLLVAQLVRAHYDVDRILVLTHDPERLDPITAAGHEPICATTAVADAVARDA